MAAIADFVIAITVLIPERVGLIKFEYPMGMMSAIAFSWGILLVLADQKPVKRRWILIPTLLVVTLLTAVGIYAILIELIDLNLISLSIGVILIIVITYSYVRSKDLESKTE